MLDRASLRISNEIVWRQIKYLFLGSATIFLVNIYFGFDNALTVGDLPRWQLLIHLHGGSIGWITLSIIAMAVWIFSSGRQLTERYASRVKTLTRVVIVAFAGYVISFGLAFSQQGGFFFLLPVFGTLSAASIWVAAAFAVSQFGKASTKTAPKLMVMGALLIASLGALMGLLLGLENALETTIIPGLDRITPHAGVMDGYLLLAASALVGWQLGRDSDERYTRGALAQFICFALAPLSVWIGSIVSQEMLAGLSAPLILVGVILFAVRNAPKVLRNNPLKSTPDGWTFFGAIWTVIWALLFAYLIFAFIVLEQDFEAISPWLVVLFAHSAFVGTMTNLILGAISVRSRSAAGILPWAEPASLWLVNLGLIFFILLEFTSESRLGAIVMGVGVLLGVGTMIARLLSPEVDAVPAIATD